ncbi:hypothetical protein ABPG72_004239 [Tetrahymena utriculariae]
MSKKRFQDDSYQGQDYQQQEGQRNSSANEEDGNQQEKKFMCKCGKGYGLQSSLFNHIRIKHEDRKAEWAKERNVKPGRPKNTETTKDKVQKNPQKKEKKPEGVDQNTWELLKLFRNPLFNELIVKFRLEMKDNYNEEKDDDIWKLFQEKRKELFLLLNLPPQDNKSIEEITDSLLKSWGKLLKVQHQASIYITFLSEFILNYYDLSDDNKAKILKWISEVKIDDNKKIENQKDYSKRIQEVLIKNYSLEIHEGQAQNQKINQSQEGVQKGLNEQDGDDNDEGEEDEDQNVDEYDDGGDYDGGDDDDDDDNDGENANAQAQGLQEQQQEELENYEEQKDEVNINNGQYFNQAEYYNQEYGYQQNQQTSYSNQHYQHDNQNNYVQNNNINNNNNNVNCDNDFQIEELLEQTNYVDDNQQLNNNNNLSYLNPHSCKQSSYNMMGLISRSYNQIQLNEISPLQYFQSFQNYNQCDNIINNCNGDEDNGAYQDDQQRQANGNIYDD